MWLVISRSKALLSSTVAATAAAAAAAALVSDDSLARMCGVSVSALCPQGVSVTLSIASVGNVTCRE